MTMKILASLMSNVESLQKSVAQETFLLFPLPQNHTLLLLPPLSLSSPCFSWFLFPDIDERRNDEEDEEESEEEEEEPTNDDDNRDHAHPDGPEDHRELRRIMAEVQRRKSITAAESQKKQQRLKSLQNMFESDQDPVFICNLPPRLHSKEHHHRFVFPPLDPHPRRHPSRSPRR